MFYGWRSGGVRGPAAWWIASTSCTSASPSVLFGGQLRSGETHPCHLTCVDVPNDALFMHGGRQSRCPYGRRRGRQRSAPPCRRGMANAFGVPGRPPRLCIVTDPLPSGHTSIE